jgi:vacuolar-type H+-ATPase subunit E/Vma4
MQEIVSADTIQTEILDDAKKKAARIFEESEAEAARDVAEIEARAVSVVEEIFRSNEAKSARYRMETMAHFPLEKTRMLAVFVDEHLREATGAYIASLPEERVAGLASAMLRRGASYLEGKAILLARKGLPEGRARAAADGILARAASVELGEDESLPAPGFVASALDGSVELKATMDLVEEALLDRRRGELARALCAGALTL